MNKVIQPDAEKMIEEYASGLTIKRISERYGVSVGTVFNTLHQYGCRMRKPGFPLGSKLSQQHIERSARARRGKPKSAHMRMKLSETKKCHLNGFNGIGHLKRRSDGYIAAYVPDHPNARADGYVMLHTIVMERHLGRYLNPNEVVHHINHIRNDNRLENLLLMDKHEHYSMHMRERNAKRRDDLLIV